MKRRNKWIVSMLIAAGLVLSGAMHHGLRCYYVRSASVFDGPALADAAAQKYTCGMHPMIIVDEPGLCPICNMDLTPLKTGTAGASAKPAAERRVKYWVAPMDPTYIRDEPGKSPMGMDLVPVYEDEAPGGAVISIDPVTSQNMGVRTARVELGDLSRVIRTVGLVGYEEPKQYSVNSKIGGWIEKLYVAQTGQHVQKNQPLLEIYSPELVSAQEEYLLALSNSAALKASPFPEIAGGAARLLEASRQRLKFWDISERQIRQLEKTGKARKTLTLYAPYGGVVTMKMVTEGMYAKPGVDLLQLSDISQVWVYADIYEYELPWVKEGQPAQVELPFGARRIIEGKISTLYPYVEAKTRTVKARIDLQNPDFELRPDMYVNVKIAAETVRSVLTIPVEAVLNSGTRQTVFVALGEGKFEPRLVKTGLQNQDGRIEIRQGLLEGEQVVTSAQFMLDSESKLREAIQKMLEPKKDEHAGHAMGAAEEDLDDLFGEDPDKKQEDLDDLFK